MKCEICNNDAWPVDSNVNICNNCTKLNRSELFSKILSNLLDMNSTNEAFDVIKDKCIHLNTIIKKYPLFITPVSVFDPEEHDTDRIALDYLRSYVISEDNSILQKYHPVKIDTTNNSCIYKAIALICRLDIEEYAKEFRVRNVVDMVINAEVYHSLDPDLHSCLKWGDTWKHFVFEQLHDTALMKGPNAVLTLCLQSLSNIVNMKIRSVYPKISGGSDDLRKRLNRIFSPSDVQSNASVLSTLSILWSNTKKISSHSTSSTWMPNCVVPLLLKADAYTNEIIITPPTERSFYILSCFCPITQGILNQIVSYLDQQKHLEAQVKKEDAKVPEFNCPKCSKLCNNYHFDWRAVTLFRQNFMGGRFTYILIDVTSSMIKSISLYIPSRKNSSIPRITQTKEAVKQLLIEIAAAAGPLDQVVLTTFDDKLKNPPLIPLCKASEVSEESYLKFIDAIELSPRSIQTYFYSVLREVYETFERQPFLYTDLYLFSDGIDTSPKKNDKAYQAIIRGLNEKIGAKCHFMTCNSSSSSEGFSVAGWLGDAEADNSITGSVEEIKAQVKAVYRRDHARTLDLTPSTVVPIPNKNVDTELPKSTTYMTDDELALIRRPIKKDASRTEVQQIDSSFRNSNPNLKSIYDYFKGLPSANRARSSSEHMGNRSQSSEQYMLATRNPNVRKIN